MNRERAFMVFCMVMIAVAVLLRVLFVSSEALWGDEVFTIRFASVPFGEMMGEVAGDVHPPLYFIIMQPWVSVAGTSETALRLPSVLFSIAAIGFFYFLCRRLRMPALMGTALFALSLSGLVYAHEARMYTLFVFLVIGAWYFLADILQRQRGYVGYGIFTLLLLYTHVAGIVLFVLNASLVFVSYPLKMFTERRFMLATFVPFGIYGITWLPFFVMQILAALPLLLIRLPIATNGLVTSSIFWFLFLSVVIIGTVLVGFRFYNPNRSLLAFYEKMFASLQRHAVAVAVLWASFFVMFYHFFASTNPFVRYFIFLQPLVYLILTHIFHKKKICATAVMVFSFAFLVFNVSTVDRFDWHAAVPYALTFDGANTAYALDKAGTSYDLFLYYARPFAGDVGERTLRLRIQKELSDEYAYEYPPGNISLTTKYILILSKLKGEQSKYEDYLRATHDVLDEKAFADIRVIAFEPRGSTQKVAGS